MDLLRGAFEAKAREFQGILKMGRTQLQDAVPMTLGQEFSTYGVPLSEDMQRLRDAEALLREINLGSTAVGSGVSTHPEYAAIVCRHLSRITGLRLATSVNLAEATQD